MNLQTQVSYAFGHFLLSVKERQLLRDGELVSLTPKVYDLLVVLLENRGHMVDKDELMKALWPDAFVEEGNLTQNISILRKALGEGTNGYRFIETVPKRGYRFVADVKEVSEDGNVDVVRPASLPANELFATRWHLSRRTLVGALVLIGLALAAYFILSWPRSAPNDIRSVAVLPFQVMDSEPGDEYRGFGMADVLITRLSNLNQIQVRPSNSVRKYGGQDVDLAAAGRDLRVDVVVDVFIRKVADRIRVTVQLFRVEDSQLLPSDMFDEKFTDWLSVELKVAERVAQGLMLKFSGDEGRSLTAPLTNDPEAFELFQRGIDAMAGLREHRLQAVKYFEDAVGKDDRFAHAYAALADAHIQQAIDGREVPREIWPRAERAARKALEIAPDLAEAHKALGRVRMYQDRDWPGAEGSFRRAIEISKDSANGHRYLAFLLQTMGRLDEAMIERNLARISDPSDLRVRAEAGVTLRLAEKLEQAISLFNEVIAQSKDDSYAHSQLGQAYLQQGKLEKAIEELKITSDKNSAPNPLLAYAYAKVGQTGEAEKILKDMKNRSARGEYVSAFDFAIVYTGLGDKDQAFQSLGLAFEERSPNMSIKVNPLFNSLRGDARFDKLLLDAGLAP